MEEGVPLPKHEVQLGKRTGRKRGAPPGNQNRLTHGRYSGAAKAARRERSARRQEEQLLAAWTDVVWRLHRMECAGIEAPPGLGFGKRGWRAEEGGTPSQNMRFNWASGQEDRAARLWATPTG